MTQSITLVDLAKLAVGTLNVMLDLDNKLKKVGDKKAYLENIRQILIGISDE